MTFRVGPKGQVVIPKALREEFGIQPGDEVRFWREGDHLALEPSPPTASLRGRFSGSPLVDVLLHDRQEDRRRDNER